MEKQLLISGCCSGGVPDSGEVHRRCVRHLLLEEEVVPLEPKVICRWAPQKEAEDEGSRCGEEALTWCCGDMDIEKLKRFFHSCGDMESEGLHGGGVAGEFDARESFRVPTLILGEEGAAKEQRDCAEVACTALAFNTL